MACRMSRDMNESRYECFVIVTRSERTSFPDGIAVLRIYDCVLLLVKKLSLFCLGDFTMVDCTCLGRKD
jgi:hypothetical protein